MTDPNDCAYPVGEDILLVPEPGLSKREDYAGLAMQGLCANSIAGNHHAFDNLAIEAVAYADALIKELQKI